MTKRDTHTSIVAREVRPLLRRGGLVLGLGFLVLVAVPVSAAVAIALSGGPDLAAIALLGVALFGLLLVLAALPLAAVGLVWLLGLATVSAIGACVTEQRLGLLRRVEALEEDRWWGPLLRPTAPLGFLDPRTSEERFEAELEEARSAYVAGDVSENQFERELDRLFGIETDAPARGGFEKARSSPPRENDDRQASTSSERLAR